MAPKTKKIVLKQIFSDAGASDNYNPLTMFAGPPDPTAVPPSLQRKGSTRVVGMVCYKVVQTQNTVHHPIGAILTKEEVESLMSRTSSYTVVVK